MESKDNCDQPKMATKKTVSERSSESPVDNTSLDSSDLSTKSSGPSCRICRDTKDHEKLVSPCHCMGSLGYVHLSCIEKWLSQSGRRNCEVCLYEYKATAKTKTFMDYLRASRPPREQRFLYGDTTCFFLLTPLGAISSWLCVKGATEYYNYGETWTGIGLIILTSFLTLMYFLWLGITLRYHFWMFRRWQRTNTEISLILSQKASRDPSEAELANPIPPNGRDASVQLNADSVVIFMNPLSTVTGND